MQMDDKKANPAKAQTPKAEPATAVEASKR